MDYAGPIKRLVLRSSALFADRPGLKRGIYGGASAPELLAITRASGGRASVDENRFVASCGYEYLRVLPIPGKSSSSSAHSVQNLNLKSNVTFKTTALVDCTTANSLALAIVSVPGQIINCLSI